MKPYFLLFALVAFSFKGLLAQTNLEIISGEKMYADEVKKLTYLIHNVGFRHNGVTIYCDSAIRKTQEGIVEGFGHINIFQQDTFTLTGGEYLKYDEATKTAIVTGKQVILSDREMNLTTTALQYNTSTQTGSYHNSANIISSANTLKSRHGYYHRRSSVFNFKGDVVLTNPEYTMYCDTLDYYELTKTAYFFGPTRIVGKENTILCNYGWYNTRTEKAQFSKEAVLISDSMAVSADSLLYDRKKGMGNAYGNIKLTDSSNQIEVYGQKGLYLINSGETYITDHPVAIQNGESDTFYVLADTFYYVSDSLRKQLQAYPSTSITQKDFQGRCDSLVYRFNDSTISLYHSPILWNDLNQITGDTMHILLRNKSIKTLTVIDNAFLASEIKPRIFNQISGRTMINHFDSNKLKTVMVEGNAESIYYLRDNETDTAQYTGVNKVACSRMLIRFDSSKVDDIRFYGKPEGKMYPVRDFPENEMYLKGLDWRIETKPLMKAFLDRKKRKTLIAVPATPTPKKTTKPKKKVKK